MSLAALVLMTGALGAVLFFAAGFLIASGRGQVEVAAPPSTATEAWSDAVGAQLDGLRAERDQLGERHQLLAAELRRSADAEAAATQALEHALARQAVLERDLAARAGADATLDSWRGAAATADRRAVEALDELQVRTAELDQSRRALADLTARLEQHTAGEEEQRRDLGRLRGDLERACDEIASLRVERLRAGQADAARLAVEGELRKLQALHFAASAAGSARLGTLDLATTARASAASLADLVRRVQSQGHYQSVAIADELGLTAAGVGPHTDELAAFTSLLLGVSARASRFFPMHEFGHATLADAHGVSIEARPVAGPEGFVLMTLGSLHPQDPP